ncbi:MAG: hypothetical protein MUF15_18675 [Acidobacteria bacterium]|jgi:hypothetical protein|nr:hypothetical protein [Acidobacteriota bacterium]
MKKIIRKFYPIFFGLSLFLLYFAIYSTPDNSENYSTALAVFTTALGSSALIVFHSRRDVILFYFYPLISVIIPFLAMYFFHLFDSLEQKVIIGFQAGAFFMLIIFIVYLAKKE